VLGEIAPEDGAIGIMSFDPTVGRWFRRNRKQIRRGLVIGKDTPPLKRWLAMTIAAPHFIAVHCELLGSRWAARIGKRIPVYSWTIRTGEQRAQAGVHADALIWEGDGRPRI
jgi:hypothetical protein